MSTLMETWPRRHRITVDEYYRMAEVGLLAPDARVELFEGEIIDMAPIGTDHAGIVNLLTHLAVEAMGRRAVVQIQGPVRFDSSTELQPDVALLVPRRDFYRKVHAQPEDVLLLIEVSDSTLRYDRDAKVPLYARHGIPEVWIIDVQQAELRIYREPSGGMYRNVHVTADPGHLPLAALPGAGIDLTGVFRG